MIWPFASLLQAGGARKPGGQRLSRFLTQPLILEEAGPPRGLQHFLLVVSLLVGGFIAWAAIIQMKETAPTSGQVMPAGSVQVVQHLEGGIVAEIMVVDGQLVDQAEPLMRLQTAAPLADRDQLRAREVALVLKTERLRAFVQGSEPDFSSGADFPALVESEQATLKSQLVARSSQLAVLRSRIEQRQARLDSLGKQQVQLKKQVAFVAEEVEMRRILAEKGLVSRIVLLENQRSLTKTKGELSANLGEINSTREALKEVQGSILELKAKLGNDARIETGTATAELAQVREQLRKLEDRVQRLEIRSPTRGIVKGLATRTRGSVVAPGEVIMEIVPYGGALVAEVQIDPRDVGHLRIGQEADVKVTTYDLARFGSVDGRLDRISASTFMDDQGNPYFRGIIALSQNFVGTDPGRNLILPGMVVDANIVTGERSLFRYLLKPLYRSLDSAFSER